MPVNNETRSKALELCRSIGTTHGMIDAGAWVTHRDNSDEDVVRMHKLLERGNFPFEIEGRERAYPPNDIALTNGMMGAESPYGDYLDLCDAHDESYKTAFKEVVAERARHIMARQRSREGFVQRGDLNA